MVVARKELGLIAMLMVMGLPQISMATVTGTATTAMGTVAVLGHETILIQLCMATMAIKTSTHRTVNNCRTTL